MNPWPIAPITNKDLDFAVINYDFTTFTANEQSELPSLEGALDLTLLDYAGSIAEQTALIADLFTGLDDVFTVLDEIGGDDLESIFPSLANAGAQGDAILTQYNGLIGDNSGGGGGGGPAAVPVQTATGPVLACNARQGFGPGACSAYPCEDTVPFANNSGSDLTIESITLIQATGGPWTVTTDAQSSFRSGTTYHLTITATRAPQTNESAQIQIKVQGFSTPAVFCMDGGIGSSGVGGSGSTGPIKIAPAPTP